MKSLQYTFGISFGLFLTIVCRQNSYSRYDLRNSVTAFYSREVNDVSLVTCAVLCRSTEGCTYFYWHNRSCFIVNAASPGNSSVDITSIYFDDNFKDNCNLDGYDATFGGVLCVKVYDGILRSWAAAKAICELDGGQLLVMRKGVFFTKMEALKSLLLYSEDGEYWIGGNDLAKEGEFTWIDGSDVTTDGWKMGQPDNFYGSENCLELIKLVLNDKICDCRLNFICEQPLM